MTNVTKEQPLPKSMMALVYHGAGDVRWETRPRPVIVETTDAIVRITTTSICGTDLHILKGDVPSIESSRVLGHEGVGVIVEVGAEVVDLRVGDRVAIAVTTSCGRCRLCRRGMSSHCERGGWILGNRIDGTQADYVRIPFADRGLHMLPEGISDDAAVMLSCALPTSFECGVSRGGVKPGDTVAIVGAGPVGLAALMTSQLLSPSAIIVIDLDENRLAVARSLGATHTLRSTDGDVAERVRSLTEGRGVDVAIEAVGVAESFDTCQAIVAVGGHIANMGVHSKPVVLQLDRLWSANVTLTASLVDATSIPLLLTLIQSGRIAAEKLISHHFELPEIRAAYDAFGAAAAHRVLKVVLRSEFSGPNDTPRPEPVVTRK